MKSYNIKDKVTICQSADIIDNNDLDEEFRDFTHRYSRNIMVVFNTKDIEESGELKRMYFIKDPKTLESSPEPYYYEELQLLKTSDWDE